MDEVEGRDLNNQPVRAGQRRRIATCSLRTAIATGVGLGASGFIATAVANATGGEYVPDVCMSRHETAYGPDRNLGVHRSSRVFLNSAEALERCSEAGASYGYACVEQEFYSEISPDLPQITGELCATTAGATENSAQSYYFPDILEEIDTANLNTTRNHTGHYVNAFSGWAG